jgi:hypothetical protein
MAGMPIRRARKAAALAAAGEVVTFLTHPRAGLSHAEWRALSPGEKLERLFGMSLERVAETLCWGPLHELDPARLNAVVTILPIVLLISTRAWAVRESAPRARVPGGGGALPASDGTERAPPPMRHNPRTGKSSAIAGPPRKFGVKALCLLPVAHARHRAPEPPTGKTAGQGGGGLENIGGGVGRNSSPSRARARKRGCPSFARQPPTRAMAGSPMRRLRKTGAVDAVGNDLCIMHSTFLLPAAPYRRVSDAVQSPDGCNLARTH